MKNFMVALIVGLVMLLSFQFFQSQRRTEPISKTLKATYRLPNGDPFILEITEDISGFKEIKVGMIGEKTKDGGMIFKGKNTTVEIEE